MKYHFRSRRIYIRKNQASQRTNTPFKAPIVLCYDGTRKKQMLEERILKNEGSYKNELLQ